MAGELTTTNYGWTKPTVGASADAWGGFINTDLDGIDSTVKSVSNAIPAASSTTPAMDGTAAIGASATFARADHVHPIDTSRAAASALATYLPLAGGIMTGALTPSQTAGLVGTTAANNAAAGAVGEHVQADQMTNVALVTAVAKNVTSISLTAGDWDVEGWVNITFSTNGILAIGGISTTSATLPATTYAGVTVLARHTSTLQSMTLPTGGARVLIAATTTVYLVAQAQFSTGTCAVQGTIRARRRR